MSFNEFEGDKVRLRAIEPEDSEAFTALDSDTELARLCGSTHLPRSKAASRQWAEESSRRPTGDDETFLVIETLDGAIVGSLNVVRADRRNRVFRYGIGLGREHWRNGYGTEAVELLLRFYFGELTYHKVEIDVYSYNDQSIAFHEALGFQHEGRRRQSHFAKAKYHDVRLMGMTAEEFLNRPNGG